MPIQFFLVNKTGAGDVKLLLYLFSSPTSVLFPFKSTFHTFVARQIGGSVLGFEYNSLTCIFLVAIGTSFTVE